MAGAEGPVSRVKVATGLINEIVYSERQRPRITVRRVGQDGTRIEDAASTATFGNPR